MASKVDQLDFSKLRAFELVARHGTLQVAAARLNLTVSAVSTQIKRLEEIVGTELFLRTPGKLAITAEGERLAADTRSLLDAAQKALIRLHEQAAHRIPPVLGAHRDVMLADLDTARGRPRTAVALLEKYQGTEYAVLTAAARARALMAQGDPRGGVRLRKRSETQFEQPERAVSGNQSARAAGAFDLRDHGFQSAFNYVKALSGNQAPQ